MKTWKAVLVVVGIFLVMGLIFAGAIVTAGPQSASLFAGQQAQAVKPGPGFLQWGVLLYAVGEFAGLIGTGLSHIRKEKRAQAQAETVARKLAHSHTIGYAINAYALK